MANHVPHIDGTWVGRVEATELYDSDGKHFECVKLVVKSGPRVDGKLDYPIEVMSGAGREPVLATGAKGKLPVKAIRPSELPIGHVVQITGTMVIAPLESPTSLEIIAREFLHGQVKQEHVLELRNLKTLD